MPRLHEGKRCFVDFVCFDPLTQTMRRKKYYLDKFKTKKEKRTYAAELIAQLCAKLRSGWNVWAESVDNVREYTSIAQVNALWHTWIERLEAAGTLRKSSADRMRSFAHVFFTWLGTDQVHGCHYVYQLTRDVLSDFLDYLLLDKEVKPLTRNNYRTWLVGFCDFLVEKRFARENVAAAIKVLNEAPKDRDALTPRELKTMRSYLEEKGQKHFLLACLLEYYCFIRPNELCYVRIGDISVRGQSISLSGAFTKNKQDAKVGVNQTVLDMMIDLGVFNAPNDWYLFGSKTLRPGATQQEARIFRQYWLKMRRALKWPEELQFYSLKDSGIRDLANAEGIVVARDQARHSDVSTTNKYLKGDALTVHEETKHFKGNL